MGQLALWKDWPHSADSGSDVKEQQPGEALYYIAASSIASVGRNAISLIAIDEDEVDQTPFSLQGRKLIVRHTIQELTMGIRLFPSFFTVAFIAGAIFGTVSCQPRPEGYWTSPDRSQALTNQEYPADSRQCQSLLASDNLGKSQPYKARLFTQCMQAKGYQWIVESRGRHSLNANAQRSPLSLEHCSKGRLTIDAFGYQKCVPSGTKEGEIFEETSPQVPLKIPSGDRADTPISQPTSQASDGRSKDDELCRQYAKESLSSTYGVYSQCMKDRGWPPNP